MPLYNVKSRLFQITFVTLIEFPIYMNLTHIFSGHPQEKIHEEIEKVFKLIFYKIY